MFKFDVKWLKLILILLVQVGVSACNWPSYTKILSSFTDDPGFDRNLESNQISRLSSLYYYWPQTTLMLQCLAPNNTWVSLAGSEVTRNPDGSLRDFNASTPGRVVYHHYWNGDLIRQMSSSCRVQESVVSTLETDRWTYTRKQKSLTLRVVQSDGFVPPAYGDAERACFGNHPASDMWQRHSACNDPSNDSSFGQSIDESIERVSNYTSFSLGFNLLGNSIPLTNDAWKCSYNVKVDGVSRGSWGSPVGGPIYIDMGKLKYGSHSVGLTVKQCSIISACAGTLPPRTCDATNTVFAYSYWREPMSNVTEYRNSNIRFVANPYFKGEQKFTFLLSRPN